MLIKRKYTDPHTNYECLHSWQIFAMLFCDTQHSLVGCYQQGRNEGGQAGAISQAPSHQARNQVDTLGGRKVFWEVPNFFNYVQQIFPGGAKIFLGGASPPPLVTGLRVTTGAPNHCGCAEWLRGAPKSPNNVTSTFLNTVHLLPRDLSFEQWGAKLASCPWRHVTSSRPWLSAGK